MNFDLFWDFLVQTAAGLLATFLLYWILEKRLQRQLEKIELTRKCNNLRGDLVYNAVIAERVLENQKVFLKDEMFTISRYHTKGLEAFLYARPFNSLNREYSKLTGLIHSFEANNRLIDLVFQSQSPKIILESKKTVISQASVLIEKIDDFLIDMRPYLDNKNR